MAYRSGSCGLSSSGGNGRVHFDDRPHDVEECAAVKADRNRPTIFEHFRGNSGLNLRAKEFEQASLSGLGLA